MQTKKDFLFYFSHPDFTVGIGIAPIHAYSSRAFTADMEFHQTPKYIYLYTFFQIEKI
jgi:hypothetical protein